MAGPSLNPIDMSDVFDALTDVMALLIQTIFITIIWDTIIVGGLNTFIIDTLLRDDIFGQSPAIWLATVGLAFSIWLYVRKFA